MNLINKVLGKRKRAAALSSSPQTPAQPQGQTAPSVTEEEVRKRLEGLGYIE
jgi:hypothetical protein